MCVCVCGRRYGTRKTSAVVLAPTTCCSSHSNMYCVLKTTQSFQQKADINTTPRLPVSGSGRWQQTLNRSPYIEMALFFFFFFNTVLYIHPPGAQDGHDASRKKKRKRVCRLERGFWGGWVEKKWRLPKIHRKKPISLPFRLFILLPLSLFWSAFLPAFYLFGNVL